MLHLFNSKEAWIEDGDPWRSHVQAQNECQDEFHFSHRSCRDEFIFQIISAIGEGTRFVLELLIFNNQRKRETALLTEEALLSEEDKRSNPNYNCHNFQPTIHIYSSRQSDDVHRVLIFKANSVDQWL